MSINDYKDIILDYIRDNKDISDIEIARDLADNPVPYSERHIRRYVAELRREVTEPAKASDHHSDIKSRKDNAKLKDLERKYNNALTALNEVSEAFDQALLIKEHRDYNTLVIDDSEMEMTDGIACIQLSDWHCGERVDYSSTMGLNVFTPDIAKKRVDRLFINTAKLIKRERVTNNIDTILVNLGGDFINGYLHSWDEQQNHLSPIEEVIFAESLLLSYLSGLADIDGIKKIKIVCNRGNHARLTKKMQGNDHRLSLESILYHTLSGKLNDPVFEWIIPESEFCYVTVFGKTIRTFHGHQIKSNGGIGGITIPLNKQIMRWDATIRADLNMMSHFHAYSQPTSNTSLNGSLVGFNSYALMLGCRYEPPIQAFQILDKVRGITTKVPIFCD